MDPEVTARQRVAELLKSQQAILLVGAGSSNSIGYPTWKQLVENLRTQFAPQLEITGETEPEFASRIVAEIGQTAQIESYYNFLQKTFEPSNDRKSFDEFHLSLVQLGFCGIVTTNYDEVIESAIRDIYRSEIGPYVCDSIDLCDDNSHNLIFRFLRSLSTYSKPRWVLHLHGHHRNPKKLILTGEDYKKRYGEEPLYDASGRPQNMALDSLHRRVLWAILTTHPVVFVGFSLHDPFFTHILQIIGRDFELGIDTEHFAIMPYTSLEENMAKSEQEQITKFLNDHNTMPVFYNAPDINGTINHDGLGKLIMELAKDVGIPVVSSGISDLNRRMLEL
jgi:SIR2-like domain